MKNNFITLAILSFLFLTACQEKKVKTEETPTPSETTQDTSNNTIHQETVAEEFKIINSTAIDDLNNILLAKKITSEEEMMQQYSPKSKDAEGNYKYVITKVSSGNGKTIVQLLEENISDDSLESKKVIMRVVKNKDGKPIVDEIKESYKCRLNRGHQDWSAALCL